MLKKNSATLLRIQWLLLNKEKIKKITGNYPEEIYNTIMNLMADLNIPVIKRNSYDEMNLILIDAIDKYNENINT